MLNFSGTIALRRIALLVTRASEDCKPIHDDLVKIASVIDQMKRDLILGAPLDKDLTRLSTLVHRLPGDPHCSTSNCRRLRESLVSELRELVPLAN